MRLIDADKFREYCIHKLNFFPTMIDRALENQPTIETIPKGLYDQIKWERDMAIDQLKSYGVSLGEKADMSKAVHGEWQNDTGYDDWYCSECGFEINYDGEYPTEYTNFKYCGYCGAKMDGEK